MSDESPRPGWPSQQPPEPTRPQWTATEPERVTEAPRPSWDSLPARVRRSIDLKLVIAVLIGLVSVSGAVMAWQSSLAGEKATDKDRQAVAEAAVLAQAEADEQFIEQDARARFADHVVAIVTATTLEEQAAQFAAAGDGEQEREHLDEAAEQRAIATTILEGAFSPLPLANYVPTEGATGAPVFDSERFEDDLTNSSEARASIDEQQTVRDANRLRAESQRLDGWLIALVAAIVVLTVAQISRAQPLRLGLAALGSVIWIVSTVIAFAGS